MIGVLVQVAYDGTAFSGWATQKDARTVEDTLRGAILAVDPRGGIPTLASNAASWPSACTPASECPRAGGC